MQNETALTRRASQQKTIPRLAEAKTLFQPHLPCDAKKLRKVYLQLALKYHPDKCEELGATELFQAIAAAYEELLSPGAAVIRVKSPLAAAAELGDLEELQRLLAAGADVNEPDDVGISPLMFAAVGGCIPAAKLLVDHGADVGATNSIQWSVLLYAGLGDNADMVNWLVQAGAVVSSHELILTAYTGNSKSLAAMLRHAGDVSDTRTNESGKSLLHLACEGLCFLKSSAEQHASCIRELIGRVPVDAVDPRGRTCLQDLVADRRWKLQDFESSAPHMSLLEELCLAGASVTLEDASGESALSLAAAAGLVQVREVLLGFV